MERGPQPSARLSGTEDAPGASVLRQLAEEGLGVPARDPSRPHTAKEESCGRRGAVGVPVGGGGPFFYRPRCRSWGCSDGAKRRADSEMGPIRDSYLNSAFVGIHDVCSWSFCTSPERRQMAVPALWVTTVPTPPEDPKAVKERVHQRVSRLVKGGVAVECVLVPCDGATVIVSSADLGEELTRGRKHLAPTSGWWCEPTGALLFLERTLTSTAVNGRVWWSKGWKAPKPPKRAHVVSGRSGLVTKSAWRILLSEGYSFAGSHWEDPRGDLLEATRRAQKFWDDPHCAQCNDVIAPDEDHWWRDGQARCGPCDVAVDLDAILTRGVIEREIEAHLRHRRLTFKRRRPLIEAALAKRGAVKMASGVWLRIAKADAA